MYVEYVSLYWVFRGRNCDNSRRPPDGDDELELRDMRHEFQIKNNYEQQLNGMMIIWLDNFHCEARRVVWSEKAVEGKCFRHKLKCSLRHILRHLNPTFSIVNCRYQRSIFHNFDCDEGNKIEVLDVDDSSLGKDQSNLKKICLFDVKIGIKMLQIRMAECGMSR